MDDKQFNDALTTAGKWFFLSQYRLIISLKNNTAELLDKLYEKEFDSDLSGTKARMYASIRIIDAGRAQEALEIIRDSSRVNRQHPEARDLAEEILASL